MKQMVIATGNAGKVREYKEMLEPLGYEVKCLKDFPPVEIIENGKTFEENALIKARTLFEHTHIPCIADDSGLEIEALDHAPGIYSARWLGENTSYDVKNATILDLLKDKEDRRARFVCVIALVNAEEEVTFRGDLYGEIALEARGQNGFGYDPVFFLPERGCTSAELSPEEKNEISHRGKALRMMRDILEKEINI